MKTLVAARRVRKSFGPTVALDGVDLEARAGEVHAILGENGAGKSTLLGLLGGVTRPDAGSLSLGDAPYAPRSPREAQAAGVAMVHQELDLCAHLTVADNVMLGREPTVLGFVARGELEARAKAALVAAAGEDRARAIPARTRVRDLSLADRQLVEIARALADERCRVLVLDEPTSSLGRAEVGVLFERIRAMRARGLCVLYVSHFLDEVKEIADRFTVLRDGRTAGAGDVKDVAVADLVALMTGRPSAPASSRPERAPGAPALACEGVAGAALPRSATFEVRRGEVLGLAGLVGAGRTELLRVVFGLDPLAGGSVRALGRSEAARGMGMLSEDRKGEGLALGMSVADNLTLSALPRVVRPAWQRAAAERAVERLGIRCRDVQQPVRDLSGGNQQKVALGRLLHQGAHVLLLDQPTRGVDVQAKAEVHRLIGELAAEGKAILVASDDLPELLGLCDRIAVMRRGVLGAPRPASEWTERALLEAAVGAPPAGEPS